MPYNPSRSVHQRPKQNTLRILRMKDRHIFGVKPKSLHPEKPDEEFARTWKSLDLPVIEKQSRLHTIGIVHTFESRVNNSRMSIGQPRPGSIDRSTMPYNLSRGVHPRPEQNIKTSPHLWGETNFVALMSNYRPCLEHSWSKLKHTTHETTTQIGSHELWPKLAGSLGKYHTRLCPACNRKSRQVFVKTYFKFCKRSKSTEDAKHSFKPLKSNLWWREDLPLECKTFLLLSVEMTSSASLPKKSNHAERSITIKKVISYGLNRS
jgi:hypothetical protein